MRKAGSAAAIALAIASALASAQPPLAVELTLHGTIQPIAAQYIHRGLAEAAARHAGLVVISVDTPGGLLTSTHAIVADIGTSSVPVAVLAAPNHPGSDATLLADLDARSVPRFQGDIQSLQREGYRVEAIDPSLRERILTRLTDPDIAVFLLLCGIFLVYAEFNMPGTIVPGCLGALLIMLALFGLNLLPVRHTAVALLFAGLLLMALEFKVASHGILALTGVAAIVFGLATLVDAPIAELRVHIGTAIAVGIAFSAISLWLARIALLARRNKSLVGPQAMIGRLAIARTPLAPGGQVEVRGELWQASLTGGGFEPAGASVVVRAVHGLELSVAAAAPHMTQRVD
jgi:membrane-bound serine protease (ClpP class)